MDKEVERILDRLAFVDGASPEGSIEDALDDVWIRGVVAAYEPRPEASTNPSSAPDQDLGRTDHGQTDPGRTDPESTDPGSWAPAPLPEGPEGVAGSAPSPCPPDPAPLQEQTAPVHAGAGEQTEAAFHRVGAGAPPGAGTQPGCGPDASVIRLPGEPALKGSLGLARSLRPLMVRVPAAGRRILDTDATATGSSEARVLLPTWQAGTERWLSLDLVVDIGSSMAIWRSLAGELRTLLGHQGAFRDVRCWGLDSDAERPGLVPFRRHGGSDPGMLTRSRSLGALDDPSGRRTVLLLTDGVGPLWGGRKLAEILGAWSRTRPVAVLQVLPRTLWHRTRLYPVPVDARPSESTSPVPVFRSMRSMRADQRGTTSGGWIPVLEVDSEWIGPWAGVIAGSRPGWTPMLALPGTRPPQQPEQEPSWGVPAVRRMVGVQQPERIDTPEATVERFRSEVSPLAFELAGYLAGVPLCLPVMRLLQQAMLPQSGARHLAEVFLSGLLVKTDTHGGATGDPEDQLYDFRDGVREQLLATLTRTEALRVLDVAGRISDRIVERFGGTLDFRALVRGDAEGGWTLLPGSLPFARITLSVLDSVGSSHRRIRARIAEAVDAADPDLVPVGARALPAVPDPLPTAAPEAEPEPGLLPEPDWEPEPEPQLERVLPPEPAQRAPVQLRYRSKPSIGQPMLFVGLGGTGARIGAELEQRLRSELCGPDGKALGEGQVPYRLPGCLQFVLADLADPVHAPAGPWEPRPHLPEATIRASRRTTRLRPQYGGSTELNRTLRLGMPAETGAWLPPTAGEPRLASLADGTGQLPTLARAGLFSLLQRGPESVLEPLLDAVDAIVRSDGELMALGGGPVRRCDVFVAFSAGGGTGAGVFLDYLHLISQAFSLKRVPGVRIHPLVLLPSALPGARGALRKAVTLNTARALIDLFRLVDEQNAPSAAADLGDGAEASSLRIHYPKYPAVRLSPGILPTALLFGGVAGADPGDLQSSVVSFVMSLITPESPAEPVTRPADRTGGGVHPPGSTADFLDDGASRRAVGSTGLGRSGVSTALTATLTVPVGELAQLMACRTLAAELGRSDGASLFADQGHRMEGLVKRLLGDSGVRDLWEGAAVAAPPEPDRSINGAAPLEAALRERQTQLESQLAETRRMVDGRIRRMAMDFDPEPAVRRVLRNESAAMVQAVVNGLPQSDDELVKAGLLGTVQDLGEVPRRPTGWSDDPPAVPWLRGRLFRFTRMDWNDTEVAAVLREQDAWYHRIVQQHWCEAWHGQREVWFPRVAALRDSLAEFALSVRRHADRRLDAAEQGFRGLSRPRPAVVCLLPPPPNDLDRIQRGLEAGLARDHAADRFLGSGAIPGLDLGDSAEGAAHALDTVLADLTQAYTARLCRRPKPGEPEDRLLPPMSRLLAAAAGSEAAAAGISAEALAQFTRRLAELVPPGCVPEGPGQLKALIIRPVTQWHPDVDSHLAELFRRQLGPRTLLEFRAVEADSITVVMVRTGMGLLGVPETRGALRTLARAGEQGRRQDLLAWRQRLGHLDDPSPTAPDRRREVLHRLLCCLWNGQVKVLEGSPDSPERIRIGPTHGPGRDRSGGDGSTITLRLDRHLEGTSSWAGLLTGYERWACENPAPAGRSRSGGALLSARPLVQPGGGGVVGPDPLFLRVVTGLPSIQLARLGAVLSPGSPHLEPWSCARWRFWAELLPGALELRFDNDRVGDVNLRSLLKRYGHPLPDPGAPGHDRRPPWE